MNKYINDLRINHKTFKRIPLYDKILQNKIVISLKNNLFGIFRSDEIGSSWTLKQLGKKKLFQSVLL